MISVFCCNPLTGEMKKKQMKFFPDAYKNRIGKSYNDYTERVRIEESGTKTDVTRLISARMATEFERGLYYGKNE